MDFTGKKLVHTPEGVRDIYGQEFASKLHIQNIIQNKLNSFGYQGIQTPSFEFFDVFGHEVGTTPSKELYKFFDKEGNTLVLRPDFTPSIARCAAKYFMDESIPLRFCYSGNNYINTNNLQGKLKETTQMGAELIGDSSAQADAEMIAMLVETLKAVGLKDFQISVGQIEFVKGLCAQMNLDEDTEYALREFISVRNTFGAEELLSGKGIAPEDIAAILKISELFGSYEVIEEARKSVNNARSNAALDRLCNVYELLKLYGVEEYISFDLGMVSKYNYYTGVIFSAYTYQAGSAIAKGGRYDNLLEKFGKPSAATGFVMLVDDLMTAMQRQNICSVPENKNILILYKNDYAKTLSIAKEYRENGFAVTCMLAEKEKQDYEIFAKEHHFVKIIDVE